LGESRPDQRATVLKQLSYYSTLSKRSELGASLVEYALLLALISVAGIASVSTLGDAIGQSFGTTTAEIQGAGAICVFDPPWEMCDD
jgi:Flp pilus assembly pilin Flp